MWHHFGPHALPLEPTEKTGVAGHNPDEWRNTFLADENGQLYVLGSYIFSCVREAAKFTKIQKRSATHYVSATLEVEENRVFLDRYMPKNYKEMKTEEFPKDPTLPVYLDVRGVVVNRSRHIRYRVAASPSWRLTFHILWDPTIVARNVMQSIVNDAGELCGIGDGRNIGFGRFEVERFEVLEDAEEATSKGGMEREKA